MVARADQSRPLFTVAIPRLAGAFASLVGGLSLVGWILEVPTLKSVVPGFAIVQANAAVSFVLLGTGCILLLGGPKARYQLAAGYFCAALVLLLATLTLTEYLFPTGLNLDIRWLNLLWEGAAIPLVGRMSIVSAWLFLMLALALVIRRLGVADRASELLAGAVVFVGMLALTGEAFRLTSVEAGRARPSPFPIVMALMALGAAILAARPDRGWAAILASREPGGVLARRLLPAAIFVPFAIGWLRLAGEEAGYYGTTFGTMLFVLANMVIFSVLTMQLASVLNRADLLRAGADGVLRGNERRFRALIENGHDAITLTGPDGAIRYASPTARRILDDSQGELVGTRISALVHPDDLEDFLARERQVFATAGAVVSGECRIRQKDGTWRWVEATRTNCLSDPAVAAVVGNYRDINERRQAEDALRASEWRQRFLADLASEVQLLTDPDEIMAVTAQRLGEYLNADRCAYAEVEGDTIFAVTGDYNNGVASIVGRWPMASFGAECVRKMLTNEPYVVHDAEADGRIGPVELPAYWASSIRSAICVPLHKGGRLTAAMAVHKQIARAWTADEVALVRLVVGRCWESIERARVVRSLRKSEAQYRTLFTSIDQGFCVIEVLFDEHDQATDYRFLEVNPAFEKHTGLTDAVGRTVRELIPGHESHWFEAYGRVARTGQSVRFENRAKVLEDRWYDVYAFRIGEPEERHVAVLFTDVTARRHSEERLRASESRLRLALASARMVAWERDLETNTITLSENAEEVLGIPPGTTSLTADDWSALVCPEDQPRRQAVIAHAIERREGFSIQYRVTRPRDGAVSWVEAWGHTLSDSPGAVNRLIGVLMDVTERKRAEAARLHFQALFESAPGMYLVLDPGLIIVGASDAYLRATKTDREKIVGRSLFDVFPDNPADPVADGVRNLQDSLDRVRTHRVADVMAVQRYPIRRPESEGGEFEERYWSPLNSPVFGPDGELAYIVHRVEDVTEYVRERGRAGQDPIAELESRAKHMEAEVFLRGKELERVNRALRESEELFRGAFEDTSVATVLTDLENRFLRTNAAFDKLFGYTRGQMAGMTMVDFTHREDQSESYARREELLSGRKKHFQMELRYRHRDGHDFWGLTNVSLVRDADGRAVRYVGQVQDVTDRKRAEAELRQSEHRYRELFERNPQPMWVFDAETLAFLAVNEAAVQRYGYSRAEFLAMTIRDIRPPEERMSLEDHLQTEWPGPVQHGSWRHQWKNGTVRQVEITSHDLVWEGHPARLVLANDVTERQELEDRLRKARDELERRVGERTADLQAANKELEAFSYSVSHDLRAPLRAINGFSRILLEKHAAHLPPEARENLQEVRDSAREMGQLVDDLLAFSRLGRQPLRMVTVDIAEVVRNCLVDLRAECEGRAVEVSVGDLPPCSGDPALIKQVWINLLSNAVKYSRLSTPARIEVGTTADGAAEEDVTYHVRDNGVGFDMRYAHKLFGVFQRLHRAEEYEGNGVGLATVQRIVHRHGGRVWADARPGEGATFYFTLKGICNEHAKQ